VVSENTGMFVAIAVAALCVAALIVIIVCWKFRKGNYSSAALLLGNLK
jgi:hypothetical protein